MIEFFSFAGFIGFFGMFIFSIFYWPAVLLKKYAQEIEKPKTDSQTLPELFPLDQIPDGHEGARTEEHATQGRQGGKP